MGELMKIYSKLLHSFGPLHWWPVTSEGKLHPEYSGGPTNEKQQLEVIFGAILTQNTSWKNVEKAIAELNKNNLVDAEKIFNIENKKLAEIIRSSGYHNQKAKKLKNFCEFLFKNCQGELKNLFQKEVPELRKELLSVNGIGPETADSIILYSAKKPIFVIDAYTKRIMGRIGFNEESYGQLQQLFMRNLQNSEKLFNEYHALLVELGKNYCKTIPLCNKCPLKKDCNYYNLNK